MSTSLTHRLCLKHSTGLTCDGEIGLIACATRFAHAPPRPFTPHFVRHCMQNNCKSRDQTFNAKCSGDQFRTLNLQHADVVRARWENCTAAISRGASSIRVADDDIAGMKNQGINPSLQATVVTVLPRPKPSHHFRGELSAARAPPPPLLAPLISQEFSCTVEQDAVPHCARSLRGSEGPRVPHARACLTCTQYIDACSGLSNACQCNVALPRPVRHGACVAMWCRIPRPRAELPQTPAVVASAVCMHAVQDYSLVGASKGSSLPPTPPHERSAECRCM